MDMKDIKKQIRENVRAHTNRIADHGEYQISFGSIIKALSKERTGLLVKLNTGDTPGSPHAYAGAYFDLAFERSQQDITVAEFLAVCQETINTPVVGTDGLDYVVNHKTALWIADIGEISRIAITDVVPTDGYIQLVTKHIDEEENSNND